MLHCGRTSALSLLELEFLTLFFFFFNKFSKQMDKTDQHFEMKHTVIIQRSSLDHKNLHKVDSLFHITKLNYLLIENVINQIQTLVACYLISPNTLISLSGVLHCCISANTNGCCLRYALDSSLPAPFNGRKWVWLKWEKTEGCKLREPWARKEVGGQREGCSV